MADDPHRDSPRPGPAADWDQASIADEIAASARAPERRREGKRRRRRPHPDQHGWDESGGTATTGNQNTKDATIDELSAALWSERSGGGGGASGGSRQRRTGHRRSRPRARWLPWATAVGAVALLGLAAWAGVVTLRKPPPEIVAETPAQAATPANTIAQPEAEGQAPDMLEGLEIIDSSHEAFDRVKRVITDFVTAATAEERLELLRPTPSVEEHLAEASRLPLLSLGLEPRFGEKFIKSGEFVYAEVIEANIGPRGAIVEDTPDGLLLDLDSFVGHSEADWGAIASGELDGPVTTRLLAQLMPDARTESDTDSLFVIEDPTQTFRGKALLELMAIDDARLRTILQSGINLPYIFELSPEPGTDGSTRALRITRVVTTGWFTEAIFPWTKSW